MLRLLHYSQDKRKGEWPDYIHDQTPPLAPSEWPQPRHDLISDMMNMYIYR